MHIAFGVDADYIRYMAVTITSIAEHNSHLPLVFHVFTFSIHDADRHKLEKLAISCRSKIEIHIIDQGIFKKFSDFSKFSQYSKAIFIRLFIPRSLQGLTNKVLYLDSDIICVGNIRQLQEMDLSTSIVGVVSDHAETTVKRQCVALDLKHQRYFNSGVLYINIKNWLEENVTDKAIYLMLSSDKPLSLPDQDALNLVLDGRATFMDEKWNYRYNLEVDVPAPSELNDASAQAVFLHFTGRVKPWHAWSLPQAAVLFKKYQLLSPWAETALNLPSNYKEMRMYSNFLFEQGKFFGSVHWYFRYLINKFLKIALP